MARFGGHAGVAHILIGFGIEYVLPIKMELVFLSSVVAVLAPVAC